MKTAISLPNDVFHEADRYARQAGKSRSQLYADALAEYLARHSPDAITEAMNCACKSLDTSTDPVLRAATKRLLRKDRW